MRIITLVFQSLFPEDVIESYRAIPNFNGVKSESGSFLSNKYNFENRVESPSLKWSDVQPRYRNRDLLDTVVVQTSNLVAFYDLKLDMYWVEKNRQTGENGWLSKEKFKALVLREMNPPELDFLGSGFE